MTGYVTGYLLPALAIGGLILLVTEVVVEPALWLVEEYDAPVLALIWVVVSLSVIVSIIAFLGGGANA